MAASDVVFHSNAIGLTHSLPVPSGTCTGWRALSCGPGRLARPKAVTPAIAAKPAATSPALQPPPRFGSLPRFSRAVSFFTLACFLFHRLGPFRPRRAPSARPLRSRRAPGPRPGVKIIVILGEFVEKVVKLCNYMGFSNKNMKRLLFFFGAARLFCLESITFLIKFHEIELRPK